MKLIFVILALSVSHAMMSQPLTLQGRIKFLALGDSYSIGESVPQNERWPVLLVEKLRERNLDCDDPTIIATTGWRTDQLGDAIAQARLPHDFTLVSLLIGVNDQYQGKPIGEYGPRFQTLLEMAIQHAQGDPAKVFVVSIPDYGFTPFGEAKREQITREIDAYNAINRSIARKKGVAYCDITPVSRQALADPALIASDDLHPSGKMYAAWVKLMLESIVIR
ncbi:MAG TPA: SGNH/GDSL hydrolase family protein [Ohtaekwangia sp.]|nr:SGNH/GDSL hydrolase family protein [Ohtaekwangia sp.]